MSPVLNFADRIIFILVITEKITFDGTVEIIRCYVILFIIFYQNYIWAHLKAIGKYGVGEVVKWCRSSLIISSCTLIHFDVRENSC